MYDKLKSESYMIRFSFFFVDFYKSKQKTLKSDSWFELLVIAETECTTRYKSNVPIMSSVSYRSSISLIMSGAVQ